MFEPNEYLKDAVFNRNLIRIYNEFSVIAHEDPSFSTGKFDITLDYVDSQNIPGFRKQYDGGQFKDREDWDENYWALVVSSLIDNFCEERINHLKEVSHYLYPLIGRKKKETYVTDDSIKKVIPIAMTAGFAVTSVVALAIGAKTVATISGIAALAAGAYAITKKMQQTN